MDWRALYLSDQGRISRKTFWTAQLVLLGLVLMILLPILILWSDEALSTPPALGFRIFELVLAALLTWPCHAILAKRLQDRNNSPLWSKVYWGMWLVYYAISVFAPMETRTGITPAGWIVGVPLLLLTFVLFVETGFRKGQAHPNDYGDPPVE